MELLPSSLFLSRYSVSVALFIWPTGPLSGSTRPASQAWLSQESSNLRGLNQDDPPLAWCRMSLERIEGTRNLPASLVTSSLQLWNLAGTALEC
jgi:hypothetical protein